MPDMWGVSLAAGAAASVDWFARWLGIAGIAVSVLTGFVTILLWRRDGWKVRIQNVICELDGMASNAKR